MHMARCWQIEDMTLMRPSRLRTHDHRLGAQQRDGEVVAGLGNLAGAAHAQPFGVEYSGLLEGEEVGVGVAGRGEADSLAHRAGGGLHLLQGYRAAYRSHAGCLQSPTSEKVPPAR